MNENRERLPEVHQRVGMIDMALYTLGAALQMIMEQNPDDFPEAYVQPTPAPIAAEVLKPQLQPVTVAETPKTAETPTENLLYLDRLAAEEVSPEVRDAQSRVASIFREAA